MDVDLKSSRKRKYQKRSFLTVNKKCKCYWMKKISQDKPCLDISSSSSSECEENEDIQIVNSSSNIFSPIKTESNPKAVEISVKSKSIQVKPHAKSSYVQASVQTKSKSTHISKMKTLKSCGIQTEKEMKNVKKSTIGEKLINRILFEIDFDAFAQELCDNEQTEKFIKSLSSLASGKLPFTNMAWKSFLDVGSLYSCTSTMNMDYDKEWLEFCQVLYHMFDAGVINALRGRGHFSQVTSEKSQKGKYNPVQGEFNFPIPSIPTLKKLDIGFPAEIPVGFVEQSLILAQDKAKEGGQFILSFDGKLIALGCKGDSCGDSNMWGVEGPPNLDEAVKILNKTLRAAKK